MNEDDQAKWKQETLAHVFAGLAARATIRESLVFKGAQVLMRRLVGGRRGSLDIDASQCRSLVDRFPEREGQKRFLEAEIRAALEHHFESQDPVRFELVGVKLVSKPKRDHPRGWNGFEARIRVTDYTHPIMRAMPTLTIDIASPEPLLESSIGDLMVGRHTVAAYSLQRIAAEKLRGILQSLPAYRAKIGSDRRVVRAKDACDVAVIHAQHPMTDVSFWQGVAAEFRSACQARAVDCDGMSSFNQDLEITRSAYNSDPHLTKVLSFEDAWDAISEILEEFESSGAVPFTYADRA